MSVPPQPAEARRERLRSIGAGAIAAALAFLPFARGVLRGESFYFRDLALYFFPLRRFVVEGLLHREARFWNPYVHGGVPLALPPIGYPFDLLQVLLPDERGMSLLLALHLPLAAVGFFVLARSIGVTRTAAVGGAVVYSLGGFALSTLNLYVYLQAFAWSPFVMWGLGRAARGGPRRVAAAAALVGIAASTGAVEIVAQTLVLGGLLALHGEPRLASGTRVATSVALGAGLAATPLFVLAGALAGSARETGFPTEVVLAHAVHPMTLVQVVVGGLYGDLSRVADRFWGQNFFPLGFPYLLSLYLGATTLVLAAFGVLRASPLRWLLLGFLLAAIVVCLGPWAGLEPLVDWLPLARRVRYPSKAFFTVHTAVALLASLGLDRMARGEGRGFRAPASVLAAFGALLVAVPALPRLLPGPARWFLVHFFPAHATLEMRHAWLGLVLEDAARGGLVVVAAALVAFLAAGGRLRAPLAVGGLAALVAADLLRTGAGLNPTVTPGFFELSEETRRWADSVRGTGRIFTCDVAQSRSYLALRLARPGGHEAWSFALLADSLTPLFNVRARLPGALSPDLTMLVPAHRASSPREASCQDMAPLVPRLRDAGVAHVLSLDPLQGPDLAAAGSFGPQRVAPILIHTYAVRAPRPLVEVEAGSVSRLREEPGGIWFDSDALESSMARVNVTPLPGWTATVDGRTAPMTPSPDGRLGVSVPPGRHEVALRFRPPGLTAGLVLSGACGLLVCLLASSRRGRWPAPRPPS
ncbi:MAG TPA: YfhO family protein [Vicinamibacteria bacterium]|nr:YfhO family protein [Vicinamibacteria bacterium]